MARSVSLVHFEDSPGTGGRLVSTLQAEAFQCEITSVCTEHAFCAALEASHADLAVCSFRPHALDPTGLTRRVRAAAPHVPLIVVLGVDDPMIEADCLKAGAIECLSMARLGRLGWAVRRALAEREECARRDRVQTEINSLEMQLHHTQRLSNIARLASGIAHDFNNLLTIINGCCQLLLRNLPDGDALRPLVEPIEQAGTRGAELTKRLLSFSRQEPAASTLINLNKVITDVQPMLMPLLGETVRLALNLDPSLWLVRADAGEITQVVMNLVTNARDAMPDGGTVTIRTGNVDLFSGSGGSSAGSYVEMVIRDSGHGMNEDVRARIFDPFFTTKPTGKGTGLGLAIVHRIVAQGGGEIDVETAPGRGTTMRIRLPRAGMTDARPAQHLSDEALPST